MHKCAARVAYIAEVPRQKLHVPAWSATGWNAGVAVVPSRKLQSIWCTSATEAWQAYDMKDWMLQIRHTYLMLQCTQAKAVWFQSLF